MTPDQLALHLRFSAWASARLLESAARLSPENACRQFPASFESVEGTLRHIFHADRIWLERIQGAPPRTSLADPGEDSSIAGLLAGWPTIHTAWIRWAESADAGETSRAVLYQDTSGNGFSTQAWQIVLHVVNHATYHRGQVVSMLRELGVTPPRTDLIAYYRETGLAARV